MDIRIGTNSYGYPVRASQKSNAAAKASFADLMKTKQTDAIGSRDSVTITQKPLEQRLESVHQKIAEMDFIGKSTPDVCKMVCDAYEKEFGFIGVIAQTDRGVFDKIFDDRRSYLNSLSSEYPGISSDETYFKAMGYDKMTDAEKIAAITERANGNTYVHKIAIASELVRAKVITHHQLMDIYSSLKYQAEKEYCAQYGLDYMDWKHNAGSNEAAEYRQQKLMGWMAETEISWLDVLKSVEEYPAMYDHEKEAFFKTLGETANLLKRSDDK